MTPLFALFVCRGSVADGLGHVMRVRAVVEAAPRALRCEVVVIGSEAAERVLAGVPAEVSVVDTEVEAAEIADRSAAQIVIFDLIELSADAFVRIAEGRISASLSPVFPFMDQIDLAFSRTRYAGSGPQAPARGRHYGLEYAVVRPECRRIDTALFARGLDEESLSIAISLGGADAPNRTLTVLNELRSLAEPATFWVLLGEGYAHSYNELVECVRRDQRHEIILAKTNRSMWRVLGNCSLAILAGGLTTYEAAFAGLPSINVLARDGDEFLIRELVEAGVAFDAGVLGGTTDTLVETSQDLAANPERLLATHRASRGLLDGRGAARIVDRILERVTAAPAVQTA